MTDAQPTADEHCNCPSGSYSIKHSTACYERQLTDLRASLIREQNAVKVLAGENEKLRIALNVACGENEG